MSLTKKEKNKIGFKKDWITTLNNMYLNIKIKRAWWKFNLFTDQMRSVISTIRLLLHFANEDWFRIHLKGQRLAYLNGSVLFTCRPINYQFVTH